MAINCDAEDCMYSDDGYCILTEPTLRKVEVHGLEFTRCVDYAPR